MKCRAISASRFSSWRMSVGLLQITEKEAETNPHPNSEGEGNFSEAHRVRLRSQEVFLEASSSCEAPILFGPCIVVPRVFIGRCLGGLHQRPQADQQLSPVSNLFVDPPVPPRQRQNAGLASLHGKDHCTTGNMESQGVSLGPQQVRETTNSHITALLRCSTDLRTQANRYKIPCPAAERLLEHIGEEGNSGT